MTPRTLAECRFTTGHAIAHFPRRSQWPAAIATLAACAAIGWLLYLGV